MGSHRFELDIAAPRELVFDLWIGHQRWSEWVGGVSRVTDVSGPLDQPGATYTVWFGRMASPTEVLEVERPRLFRTRFGNRLLRGENSAWFESRGEGTHLVQEFRTVGRVAGVMARIFATGSWKGSFRGELNEFGRIAEREAKEASSGS